MKTKISLNIKNKQLVVIVGIIIVFLIDLFVILPWQIRSLVNLFKITKEKKEALLQLEVDTKSLEPYKKQVLDLEANERGLNASIKNEDEVLFLIENISSIAKEMGIKIMQIRPIKDLDDALEVSSKDSSYSEVQIEMSAKAGFHNFGRFLSKIENNKLFYKVDSLDIEVDDKDIYFQPIRVLFRCPIKNDEPD